MERSDERGVVTVPQSTKGASLLLRRLSDASNELAPKKLNCTTIAVLPADPL